MYRILSVAATLALATSAFADEHAMDFTPTGDAAAGEKAFRQCATCHVVVNEEGETLAGKKAKTGPNLFGIAGGKFGAMEGFKYSDIVMAANEAEIMVDEEAFKGFVMDPTKWLKEVTGDSGRSKMSFRVRKEEDAVNLYAYLHSLAPPADEESEGTDS